ncbi:hypothetical protein D3C81_1385330 [compost metagenome]
MPLRSGLLGMVLAPESPRPSVTMARMLAPTLARTVPWFHSFREAKAVDSPRERMTSPDTSWVVP